MAADPQSNVGVIDFKAYEKPYSRLFDKITQRLDNVPREGARFFAERMTNLETYKEGEVSSVLGLPMKNEDTDRIPLVAPVEGFDQTWTNIQYRLGFMVTARAIKAQKTRLIAQMMTGLPNSAQRKEEYAYASLFNEGFDTKTTADGEYIFDTDHPYEDAQHGTWSNDAASAGGFTTDSYFTAWLNFQNRKNERGFPDPRTPGVVYYPTALHEDVMKVRGSDQYPQNALNAKLPALFGQFEPVIGHWLTSTTAWFVHAPGNESTKGFLIVWEEKPNYQKLSFSDNPDIVMGRRLKMCFSVGALHSRDWYGNAGA